MTYISSVSFARSEYAIENNEVDRDLPDAPNFGTALQHRWQDDSEIDLTSPLPALATGHRYVAEEFVQQNNASGMQSRFGFNQWQHTRYVTKSSDSTLEVTDAVYWPSNGSTAQRSYVVTNVQGGIDMALYPWTVNVQGAGPLNGVIAGQMRSQMDNTDAGYPQRMTRYAGA